MNLTNRTIAISADAHTARFSLMRPPYDRLEPMLESEVASASGPGVGLIWDLGHGIDIGGLRAAEARQRGVALMIMLPRSDAINSSTPLFEVVETCRPHSIIPHHPRHSVEEWRRLLQRLPVDLGSEVLDYLTWSGLQIDRETRRIVRRTIDLSAELRTVSGLARALYVSRRALGRRFLMRGLPAPSHWLHFGRVLRAALRLQGSPENLFSVACGLGYSDGFALSNQMFRLTGVRPSTAREHLGWEWFVEQWLEREDTRNLSEAALDRGEATKHRGPDKPRLAEASA